MLEINRALPYYAYDNLVNLTQNKYIVGEYDPVHCVGWIFKAADPLADCLPGTHEFISHPLLVHSTTLIHHQLVDAYLNGDASLSNRLISSYEPMIEGTAMAGICINHPQFSYLGRNRLDELPTLFAEKLVKITDKARELVEKGEFQVKRDMLPEYLRRIVKVVMQSWESNYYPLSEQIMIDAYRLFDQSQHGTWGDLLKILDELRMALEYTIQGKSFDPQTMATGKRFMLNQIYTDYCRFCAVLRMANRIMTGVDYNIAVASLLSELFDYQARYVARIWKGNREGRLRVEVNGGFAWEKHDFADWIEGKQELSKYLPSDSIVANCRYRMAILLPDTRPLENEDTLGLTGAVISDILSEIAVAYHIWKQHPDSVQQEYRDYFKWLTESPFRDTTLQRCQDETKSFLEGFSKSQFVQRMGEALEAYLSLDWSNSWIVGRTAEALNNLETNPRMLAFYLHGPV